MQKDLLAILTSILRRSCTSVLITIVTGSIALAQTQITTGVIQGTVLDESGAVVAGANVEVKNLETNSTSNLNTGADGRFVFLQLSPGPSRLTVSKQCFAT